MNVRLHITEINCNRCHTSSCTWHSIIMLVSLRSTINILGKTMEVSGGEPSDSTKAMLAEFERRKRVNSSHCIGNYNNKLL